MAETITCITNNTGHLINLAPIPGLQGFPEGIKLIPGLNRVPNKYVDAWRGRKVAVHDADGKPVTLAREVIEDVVVTDDKGRQSVSHAKKIVQEPVYRYPGQEEIAKLTEKPVRIVRSGGKHVGPVLTIHADGTIDPRLPDGPEPPTELPGNEVHAIKMVEVTHEPRTLKLWLTLETREVVKQAIQRQLGGAGS